MTTEDPPKRPLRVLLDDARDYPATIALGAIWLLVFAMMVGIRLATGPVPSLREALVGNIGGAHAFGDMTLNEIFRGELWRLVTCTFVHYNLLHVGMNLYGFYHLGTLVESWYGSGQFLAIYLVIGGGGNLAAALTRHARGLDPRMHSGGGSTVVLGLVALCAVVGWRARSRIGDYLRGQMVGILLFTAFMGQALSMIDNYGHAGGALVGAIVGFTHRILIRTATSRGARLAGLAALIVMLVCGGAQWRDAQVESLYRPRLALEDKKVRDAYQLWINLFSLDQFYQDAAARSRLEHASIVPSRLRSSSRAATRSVPGVASPNRLVIPLAVYQANQRRCQAILEGAAPSLDSPPTADDYRWVRRLVGDVFRAPPSDRIVRSFQFHVQALLRRATQDLLAAQVRRGVLARMGGFD